MIPFIDFPILRSFLRRMGVLAGDPVRTPPHMIMNGMKLCCFLFCAVQFLKDGIADITELLGVLGNGFFGSDLTDNCHVDQLCL